MTDGVATAGMAILREADSFCNSQESKSGSLTQESPPGLFWVNYNDLSRGHPKWLFSKGIPPEMALNQVKDL